MSVDYDKKLEDRVYGEAEHVNIGDGYIVKFKRVREDNYPRCLMNAFSDGIIYFERPENFPDNVSEHNGVVKMTGPYDDPIYYDKKAAPYGIKEGWGPPDEELQELVDWHFKYIKDYMEGKWRYNHHYAHVIDPFGETIIESKPRLADGYSEKETKEAQNFVFEEVLDNLEIEIGFKSQMPEM